MKISRRLAQFHAFVKTVKRGKIVLLQVLEAKGSTPRDKGAFMVVSSNQSFGTIGGGRLELDAIQKARAILEGAEIAELELALGPEIGQCCGGRVRVGFSQYSRDDVGEIEQLIMEDCADEAEVWIFGGGHVGKALALCMTNLPVKAHLVESRASEIIGVTSGVDTHLAAMPESLVAQIAPGAAVIVLTHDHGLDFLIVSEALERDDLCLVGMIGSKTKRATFESQYRRSGGNVANLSRLTCPIGTKIADKRPSVIAVSVAAQIMTALAQAA